MLDKLLYEVVERIIGKNDNNIVDILKNKKDVNEFHIATKLKLTINQIRNLLYKLYAQDIVSFIRKKDKQKGWYIYYWSLNSKKALELLARIKEKELLQLSYLLKSRENKNFYICKGCRVDLTEETALNHNFTCPECGNLLKLSEDRKKVENINKEIEKIKKLLEITYNEINELRRKEEKIKSRKERREIAKKKEERRKKLKKKVKGKEVKKGERKKPGKERGRREKGKGRKRGIKLIKKLKKKLKKAKKKIKREKKKRKIKREKKR